MEMNGMPFLGMMLVVVLLPAAAGPLSTSSRWIVDAAGHRVKLACVNWPSHLETMVAEGLSRRPLDSISGAIAAMGFNCVRLTWPTFLLTNASLSSLTVRQSFEAAGLAESISFLQTNNPSFLNLDLIQAFQRVVASLGDHGLMVVLDNHISKPGWCCSNDDGNGFFGDEFFDPGVWLAGLTKMATLFNGTANVIAMSLRNELRGERQNVDDWFKYMQRGAEAVHGANPSVVVILSGLQFDNDLGFLAGRPVNVSFSGKLAFELHWYSFSDGAAWRDENANAACGRISQSVATRAGFLIERGWPLFLSEFGVDNRGVTVGDNRYFPCAAAMAAELDVDWALWTLQGSYYLRQGVFGLDEVYGALDWGWCGERNRSTLRTIQALQQPLRGPGLNERAPHYVFFHPSTGRCVLASPPPENPKLGSCGGADAWIYTPESALVAEKSGFCLTARGDGLPAGMEPACDGAPESRWKMVSDSGMHVATNVTTTGAAGVAMLCLDVGDDGDTLVTNPCRCYAGDAGCDPTGQWFRLVNSTRSTVGPLAGGWAPENTTS